MEEEPTAGNPSNADDKHAYDFQRFLSMVDQVFAKFSLNSLQNEYPLNIENTAIARELFDTIVTPMSKRQMGLVEANTKWIELFNKQPTVPNPGPTQAEEPKFTPVPQPESDPACESISRSKEDPFPDIQPEPPPPITPIKPQWQNIDPPADDPDFVPNEQEQVSEANGWRLVAASVRGKSHAHKGTFRDDAFSVGESGPWTFAVVSDGAGSSKLSRVASHLACNEVIKSLTKTFANYVLMAEPGDMANLNSDLTRVRAFLVDAARAAQDAVNRELEKRELTARDMYATLLVTAHTMWGDQEVVAALQVGDGSVGVFFQEDDGQHDCTVLGDADHGDYSSETRFLITPGIEREFANRTKFTVKRNIRCIGVMSDGVSDDFFPEETNLIQLFGGAPIDIEGLADSEGVPLQGVLPGILEQTAIAPEGQGKALSRWLQYEKRGSFDDRTLVLLYRRAP